MPRAVRDDARAFFDEASVCRGVGFLSDADADARRRNASVPAPRSPARRERPLPPRGTVSCASLVVIHPCNQSRHGIIDSRESGRVAPHSKANHSPNLKNGWLQFSTIGRSSGFSLAVFMDTGPRPWSPSSNARLRRTTSCRHNTEPSDNGKLATLDHSGFLRCVALPKP